MDFLPNEIICEILKYINRVDDLLSLTKTCLRFKVLLQYIIKHIHNEELRKVSIADLAVFPRLERVTGNALLSFQDNIENTPHLIEANFYIQSITHLCEFSKRAISILKNLDLSGNFKFFTYYTKSRRYIGLIIEKGKFMFTGMDDADQLNLKNLIYDIWVLDNRLIFYNISSSLKKEIVDHRIKSICEDEMFFVKRSFKEFLRNFMTLPNIEVASKGLIHQIFKIYILSHRLAPEKIKLDENIRKYIKNALNLYNSKSEKKILEDEMTDTQFKVITVISAILIPGYFTLQELNEFEIPEIFDEHTYQRIKKKVQKSYIKLFK